LPKSGSTVKVVEQGSYDVNGNLRTALINSKLASREGYSYIGVDQALGPNVDVVLVDPYQAWPFAKNSVDVVVSSSVFEHDSFFWLSFLRIAEIMKPGGFLYLSIPSAHPVHRYPKDNWRFLGDSAEALQQWAHYNGQGLHVIYNETLPHTKIQDPREAVDGVYTDVFMVFWKSDVSCEETDGTCDIAQTSAAQASVLRASLSSITESFFVNMRAMAEIGKYEMPESARERLREIQTPKTSAIVGSLTSMSVAPIGDSADVVRLPYNLLEYMNCEFAVSYKLSAPDIPAGAVYLQYSMQMILGGACSLHRYLILTLRELQDPAALDVAVAAFAREFGISIAGLAATRAQIWSDREQLVQHIFSAMAGK
jgi:predicted SAM-dependent methyltransferase